MSSLTQDSTQLFLVIVMLNSWRKDSKSLNPDKLLTASSFANALFQTSTKTNRLLTSSTSANFLPSSILSNSFRNENHLPKTHVNIQIQKPEGWFRYHYNMEHRRWCSTAFYWSTIQKTLYPLLNGLTLFEQHQRNRYKRLPTKDLHSLSSEIFSWISSPKFLPNLMLLHNQCVVNIITFLITARILMIIFLI